jgi:hypothetical protein
MGNADIALRHLTRRRPEDLARAFIPRGRRIEVLGWMDTQVTSLERRLDSALRLRVAGRRRLLHVEFCMELRRDDPFRIYDYQGFLVRALRAESPKRSSPHIQSVAIVLSGRRRRWPARGAFCTSSPGEPFSGARFRIDAVYQRTVAELRARGSVLWLVFTPLARDATVAAMEEVIAAIDVQASDDEERGELYVALLVMAIIDPWGHNLRQEITGMLEDKDGDLLERTPIVGDFIKTAREEGQKQGREEGQKQGREEGQKQGREEALRQLLGGLFVRRVGRRPTTAEERSLVERAEALGANRVEDTVLDLERDALVRWLAEPLPRAPARQARQARSTR